MIWLVVIQAVTIRIVCTCLNNPCGRMLCDMSGQRVVGRQRWRHLRQRAGVVLGIEAAHDDMVLSIPL
jgi:hypothetical protein